MKTLPKAQAAPVDFRALVVQLLHCSDAVPDERLAVMARGLAAVTPGSAAFSSTLCELDTVITDLDDVVSRVAAQLALVTDRLTQELAESYADGNCPFASGIAGQSMRLEKEMFTIRDRLFEASRVDRLQRAVAA